MSLIPQNATPQHLKFLLMVLALSRVELSDSPMIVIRQDINASLIRGLNRLDKGFESIILRNIAFILLLVEK